jgi:hypothetical protein
MVDLSSGDLTVNLPGGAAALVNTGTVTIASVQSLGVEGGGFANSGTVSLGSSSVLQATGTYKQSAGMTTLGGGILTAGTIDVEGGVLAGPGTINGDVHNAAELDVGSRGAPGLLTIEGSYTQTTTGDLKEQIGGASPGDLFDQLAITGQAALDGTLTVKLINGFMPKHSEIFVILTFASELGAFATFNGDAGHFTLRTNPGDLALVGK